MTGMPDWWMDADRVRRDLRTRLPEAADRRALLNLLLMEEVAAMPANQRMGEALARAGASVQAISRGILAGAGQAGRS